MAKTKAPLFSTQASGDLGKAIQYVCGSYTRMKPKTKDAKTDKQNDNRDKWLNGANKWKSDLSGNVKDDWNEFVKKVKNSGQCVDMPQRTSGYNLWIKYWMDKGEDGWTNYPSPPGIS